MSQLPVVKTRNTDQLKEPYTLKGISIGGRIKRELSLKAQKESVNQLDMTKTASTTNKTPNNSSINGAIPKIKRIVKLKPSTKGVRQALLIPKHPTSTKNISIIENFGVGDSLIKNTSCQGIFQSTQCITNKSLNPLNLSNLSSASIKHPEIKGKKAVSMSTKAKQNLKNIFSMCLKEESINLRSSNFISKSIQSRNKYYDVNNPILTEKELINKEFSSLINGESKATLSFLSQDKNKIFTLGAENSGTRYLTDLNPVTVYKFRDFIQETYGNEVIPSVKRAKVKDVLSHMRDTFNFKDSFQNFNLESVKFSKLFSKNKNISMS